MGSYNGTKKFNGTKRKEGMYRNNKTTKNNFFKKKKVKKKSNLKKIVGIDGRCLNCGSHTCLSAHHIIFLSAQGDDSLENLITLCFDCHRKAHDGFIRNGEFVSPKMFIIEVLEKIKIKRFEEVLKDLRKSDEN